MMLMERSVYTNGSTTTKNCQGPKSETVDPEIEKIAEQIKKVNAKKMVQLQQTSLISTLQKNGVEVSKAQVETNPDWTSVQGHFGWVEIGKELIPYIIRSGEKYVSDRMAKFKLLSHFKMLFTDEIWEYLPVKMISVTAAEAKLLKEINVDHCDGIYGKEFFTENDKIFRLQDAIEGYEYLTFCHAKLTEMGCSEDQRCGFIKINKSSLVPYVLVKDKKFVPLFYFEGDCEHLEKYAVELTSWDLAYLKFVCKIQGIRRTLYDHDEITVVELEYLKKFFLPGTEFEVSWDIRSFNKNDLLRPPAEIKMNSNHSQQTNKHDVLKMHLNNVKPSGTFFPPYSKQNYQRPRAGHPAIVPNVNLHHQQRGYLTQGQTVAPPQHQGIAPPRHQRVVPSQHQRVAQPKQQPRLPPPRSQQYVVSSQQQRVPPPQQHQFPQAYPSNYSQLNPLMQNAYSTLNITANMEQGSKIYKIQEVDVRNPLQYTLTTKEINGKVLVGCINMEPFNTNTILVSLEELARSLFQVELILLKNAISAMRLDMYLPNTEQINILRTVNLSNTQGLIKLSSLYENLAQIKYILGLK